MKLSVVACAFGAILIGGALAASGLLPRSPGKIVPKESHITWRGPASRDGRAPVEFELRNVGGRPVRILSVESGCGCATPTVRPTVVAPGGRAVVSVVAIIPAVGEKTASLGVHTDSPVTPRVDLSLRLLSVRKPPFVNAATGDLHFIIEGEPPPGESRTITVQTTEPRERTRVPVVRCDVPFLRLMPHPVKERAAADGETYSRKYDYRFEFASKPPPGTHAGTVIVEDPWDPTNVSHLSILVEVRPPLRAAPNRLTIDRGGSGEGHAKLFVLGRDAAGPVRVEIEGAASGSFLIDPIETDEMPGARVFTVGFKAGATVPDGTYRLVVSGGAGAGHRIIVPVAVRGGAEG